MVSAHELYQRIAQNAAERCALYRELVSQALPDDDIAAIRQYIQRQRALGSSRFQVQIEQQLQRRAGLGRPGRPAKEKVLDPCFLVAAGLVLGWLVVLQVEQELRQRLRLGQEKPSAQR